MAGVKNFSSGIWSIDSASGRGSKWQGASTWEPAWSDMAIESALEVKTVLPATFFSE